MNTTKIAIQIAIGTLGALSVWMLEDPRFTQHRRWASIVGLPLQPIVIWSLWGEGQPGLMFLAALYTAIWVRSFYRYWLASWWSPRWARFKSNLKVA